MMNGVITGKQLIRHTILVINEYGISIYITCLIKIIRGEQFTFLDIACCCCKDNKK